MRAGAVALAVVLAAGARVAHAERMADTRLFRPAVDSKGLFTVNASPILPHLGLSFGLVLDYASSVFRLEGDEGIRQGDAPSIIGNAVWGTLHFDIGLANWMVLGVQLPVGILGGRSVEHPDTSEPPDGVPETGIDIGGGDFTSGYEGQGLGNVALHAKVRILRVDMMPVGLAAIVQVGLPTVAARDPTFLGDALGYAAVTGVVDRWFGRRIKLALNVGFRLSFGALGHRALVLTNLPGRYDRFEYGHAITWGVGASFGLVPGALDLVVEHSGQMLVTRPDILHTPMEVDAGLKIFVERDSFLSLGGGFGGVSSLARGYSAPSWRIFAAFVFEPSIGDRDGDAIKDDVDACPLDPEDRDGFEDVDGCPDPDNDRDLILDVDDGCPDVPEDRDGDADDDGCPEGAGADSDGDTLADAADACPDDPEDLDGHEDAEGCPDPDNDSDGVLDVDDRCPDEPEDPDGFEDVDGCPDPDNDSDLILDVDDACPLAPEIYNGKDDGDGCPDTGIVTSTPTEFKLLEKIYFETDSAELKPESHEVLDAVVAAITHSSHIVRIQVAGHADERAPNDYNIQLTKERALGVVGYLVEHGVAAEILSAAGYGEECPVDKGHGPSAWETNRRVEFKILETTDGCTGATIACARAVDLGLVPPEDGKYLPDGGYCE
jgi:outer membrane protein OmpA-like peptidoglycan-associated protein